MNWGSVLEIRPIVNGDLDAVVIVHLKAFPNAALTVLGQGAIRRYYDWQLNGPHDSVARLAETGGAVTGFCFSGIFRGSLGGFLQKNRSYLAFCVLRRPWLVLNPLVKDRILMALFLLKGKGKTTRPVVETRTHDRSSGILSIAVDPASHGTGVATGLMDDAEGHACRLGFPKMHLTVAVDNHRAIHFYEKLGWEKEPPGDQWTGRMEKVLFPSETDTGIDPGGAPDA